MDALLALIEQKLAAASGILVYRDLYESLSDKEKRDLRGALKIGAAGKKWHIDIRHENGAIVHTIRTGERPAQ